MKIEQPALFEVSIPPPVSPKLLRMWVGTFLRDQRDSLKRLEERFEFAIDRYEVGLRDPESG